jgi:hypothetical protein
MSRSSNWIFVSFQIMTKDISLRQWLKIRTLISDFIIKTVNRVKLGKSASGDSSIEQYFSPSLRASAVEDCEKDLFTFI